MSDSPEAGDEVERIFAAAAATPRPELDRERERKKRREIHEVIKQLQSEVEDCAEMVSRPPAGRNPRWYDAYRGNKRLADECQGEGDPSRADWPTLNRIACRLWLRQWSNLAWLVRCHKLDDVVRGDPPEDPTDLVTHTRFVRLLEKKYPDTWKPLERAIAVDLAAVRARLVREAPPDFQGRHYELSLYFSRWLGPRLSHALRRRLPADSRQLPEHKSRAIASLEWAVRARPYLETDPLALWEYIRDSGECSIYATGELPAFESWRRYVNDGRRRPPETG